MKKKYKLFWCIIKYRLENFFEKNSLVSALLIARNLKMEEQITIDSINEIFPTICLFIEKLVLKGEMAEWFKAHAWKACLGETLSWVRIPLSPPLNTV